MATVTHVRPRVTVSIFIDDVEFEIERHTRRNSIGQLLVFISGETPEGTELDLFNVMINVGGRTFECSCHGRADTTEHCIHTRALVRASFLPRRYRPADAPAIVPAAVVPPPQPAKAEPRTPASLTEAELAADWPGPRYTERLAQVETAINAGS